MRARSRRLSARGSRALVLATVGTLATFVAAHPAYAGGASLTAIGRVAAPLIAGLDGSGPVGTAPPTPAPGLVPGAATGGAQQQQRPEPPPVLDPASGAVLSILGGSIFSGASAFQTGAAMAYFFGDKASFGFEVEGSITFGPGGRVSQAMGSFVWQTGARTSKFVPFFAVGGGYLHATSEYASATQEVLDEFGIDPQPKTEQGPFVQYGGGLRFYLKPRVAIRADVRFALVPLDLEQDTSLWDRMFGMRRIAGMLSFDF